jgi:hypothetical protein
MEKKEDAPRSKWCLSHIEIGIAIFVRTLHAFFDNDVVVSSKSKVYICEHSFLVNGCVFNMPNVTISVPEKLKAEMDTLSEVNWSEICRKAISRYIDQRKNPTPNIEFDLREVRLDYHSHQTGYPALDIPLRIHNKMESEIIVDRILFNARFIREDGYQPIIGSGFDLYKRIINPNSIGVAQISLTLPKEKIASLEGAFTSTFRCDIRCVVFVEGFRTPYRQDVTTRIPIDDWDDIVRKVLKTPQSG